MILNQKAPCPSSLSRERKETPWLKEAPKETWVQLFNQPAEGEEGLPGFRLCGVQVAQTHQTIRLKPQCNEDDFIFIETGSRDV